MLALPQSQERGLPASIDAERSILGAILLDNAAFTQAAEKLVTEDFALEGHRRIYARMAELVSAGRAVDIVTLAEELSRHREIERVGGVAYLASLTENLPRRVSIEEYVRIVLQKSTLRQIVGESARLVSAAMEQQDDAEELLADSEATLQGIRGRLVSDTLQSAATITRELYPKGEQAIFERTAKDLGVSSGLKAYDGKTCGFQPKELTIVAARPSMGKTAWLGNVAEHAAVEKRLVVAVFSLEMSKKSLLERMYCSRAQVDFSRFRKGILSQTERAYVSQAYREIVSSPLYIDDSSFVSASTIRARCQHLKQREGSLDLILIDYIGLMRGEPGATKYGNRQEEVSATSRALKGMAKELDAPVICLAQLNRLSETRKDKKPMLSDLRESGAIEQDADVVAFLHREEYYDRSDESLRGKAEIILAKQRNGPTGSIPFAFSEQAVRWADVDSPLFT